nr:hypothetical protein [Salmonella sp.]
MLLTIARLKLLGQMAFGEFPVVLRHFDIGEPSSVKCASSTLSHFWGI